jgi:hypothetical protein
MNDEGFDVASPLNERFHNLNRAQLSGSLQLDDQSLIFNQASAGIPWKISLEFIYTNCHIQKFGRLSAEFS